LLLAINLFNYIDRQVLSAVLPKLELDATLFAADEAYPKTKLGLLATAFMVSYMLLSPIFGWLGDRGSRWRLVGIGVILWSLASGGSGLATSFMVLFLTRCLVGVGEAAYGPVAPAMLSDLYPVERRGKIMAWFYLAIPVGSALGFLIGGQIADTEWGWRGAFQAVVIPGVLLGIICFFMKEPPREQHVKAEAGGVREYFKTLARLFKVPSYFLCIAGMTCTTFVLGGLAIWMPSYLFEREARFLVSEASLQKFSDLKTTDGRLVVPAAIIEKLRPLISPQEEMIPDLKPRLKGVLNREEYGEFSERFFDAVKTPDSITLGRVSFLLGAILAVSGLIATLFGGWLGDRLRTRYAGSYFLVSGWGVLLSLPFFFGMLYLPIPWAWIAIFVAEFGLFVNTGPMNTVLANVTAPRYRTTGFAICILVIHLLGDAISPYLIGMVADASNLKTAFLLLSIFIVVAGLFWLTGSRYLQCDTERANLS
jgi:MFS family permease